MKQASAASGAERRNYFRVQDNVHLRYRQVSARDVEQLPDPGQTTDRFSVAASFAARSQELRPLLNSITGQSPDVGRYLAALDEKLNEIAQLMMLQELDDGENVSREVSLGAGGIGFVAATPVPAGSLLELRILLPASLLGLQALGSVVRCEETDGGHWVAVQFTSIREQDRDLLVRHLLGRQLTERRRQRDGDDQD